MSITFHHQFHSDLVYSNKLPMYHSSQPRYSLLQLVITHYFSLAVCSFLSASLQTAASRPALLKSKGYTITLCVFSSQNAIRYPVSSQFLFAEDCSQIHKLRSPPSPPPCDPTATCTGVSSVLRAVIRHLTTGGGMCLSQLTVEAGDTAPGRERLAGR